MLEVFSETSEIINVFVHFGYSVYCFFIAVGDKNSFYFIFLRWGGGG